jgi:2-dehydropantoate 2-reductase
MNVCVVGAGAIGGLIAAKLAPHHRVSVVARGAHLQAMQARGALRFEEPGASSEVRLHAVGALAELAGGPKQDLIVIGLKAQQIGPLLPELAALVGPDTVVLPAINGLPWWYCHGDAACARRGIERIDCLDPDGAMARALEAERIVGCVVHAAAEVVAPGVVRGNGQNRLVIGEPTHGPSARVAGLAAQLEAAGLAIKQSPRIRDEVWMKLVGNTSFNPVAALTQARMDQINRNEGLITLIRKVMEEVMAVARAYDCDPLLGIDERIAVGRSIGPVKISMHQDLERGRRLEVDAIVRAPVELGRKAGLAMPFTEALLALVSELDQRLQERGAAG